MSKQNTELLKAVNGALAELKTDGGLDKIYQKWFKINAPKDVINGTTTTE